MRLDCIHCTAYTVGLHLQNFFSEVHIFMICKILGLGKEMKYPLIREKKIYSKICHEGGTIGNYELAYYKVDLLFSWKMP